MPSWTDSLLLPPGLSAMITNRYTSPMARKPKDSHPWKQWQPGYLSRPSAPAPNLERLKGITKPNRAR